MERLALAMRARIRDLPGLERVFNLSDGERAAVAALERRMVGVALLRQPDGPYQPQGKPCAGAHLPVLES